MDQIIDATGRTLNAIYSRKKVLGLKRAHNGGFQVGNTIRNRKQAAPRPELHPWVARAFANSTQEIME